MDRITGHAFASRSEVFARRGIAATSQPLATQAAVQLLREGGSAVDAAIGANAVQCVVEPTGCGLGGDLFALVWEAEGARLSGLNGSGRSPLALTPEALAGLESLPPHGPLPVSVPGCVDGWFELHGRYGKLSLDQVLAPAIRAAREGAPISELVAWYWERSASTLGDFPGFADVFLPGGEAPRKGELFVNEALASTLEALCEGGRDAFYRGRIAEELDAFFREHEGFLRHEDLAAHRSEWVAPVSVTYRDVELWELPPNGQGLAALQMLRILEGYDLAGMGFGSADHLHHHVEAKKLVYEDRARLYADPDFAAVPVRELLSEEYAAERRALIDPARVLSPAPAGASLARSGDTIYLCVADEAGNMVSLIQSNYRGMGSGMTPPRLGFSLQDRGQLFDLTPGRPNSYAPGKRPFNTIIPAFVTRAGEPWMCLGVMGGAMQPQGHVQILTNLVDYGMNLQEAGDAPRWRHEGSSQPTGERACDGGEVLLEHGFTEATADLLRARGHRVGRARDGYGGYQAVARAGRVWVGASESRKDGQAAGY